MLAVGVAASGRRRNATWWSCASLAVLLALLSQPAAAADHADDEKRWAALQAAVEAGSAEDARAAAAGLSAESLDSALLTASAASTAAVVEALLDAGASVGARDQNGWASLLVRSRRASPPEFHDAFRAVATSADANSEQGLNTLVLVRRHKEAAVIGPLRAAGAWVGPRHDLGLTALMLASACNGVEVVNVLVAAGASLGARNSDGWTSLMLASAYNGPEVVEALVAAGASVDALDDGGSTSLMLASRFNTAEVVDALLDAGASVDARSKDRSTALMGAAWNGKAEVAHALIAAGAAVELRNAAGETARDVAMQTGATSIVGILQTPSMSEQYWSLLHHPKFWALIVGAVLLAAAAYARVRLSTGNDEDRKPSKTVVSGTGAAAVPSRGAVIVVMRKETAWWRQWLAMVYRFMEVWCNTVGPMLMMLKVVPLVWLPLLAGLYGLPCAAYAYLTGRPKLGAQQLIVVRWTMLRGLRGFTARKCLRMLAGLLRVGLLVLLVQVVEHLLPERASEGVGGEVRIWVYNKAGFDVKQLSKDNNEEGGVCGLSLPSETDPWYCFPLPTVGQTFEFLISADRVLLYAWSGLTVVLVCLASLRPLAVAALARMTSNSEAVSSSEDADEEEKTRKTALEVDELIQSQVLGSDTLDRLMDIASPQGTWGMMTLTVLVELMDVVLDLNTIHTLLLNQQFWFAGFLLLTMVWSTTTELANDCLRKLPEEARKSARSGVPTEWLLRFLDHERGSEALVSLLVSAYALPFGIRTPFQALTGVASLASSAWGVAMLIHEKMDLAIAAEDGAARQRETRWSRTTVHLEAEETEEAEEAGVSGEDRPFLEWWF